jgi:hypothetical protein
LFKKLVQADNHELNLRIRRFLLEPFLGLQLETSPASV